MLYNRSLWREILWTVLCVFGLISLTFSAPGAIAQSNAANISPEGVSSTLIKAGREALENRAELSDDKKSAALAFYDTAESSLAAGEKSITDAKRLTDVLTNAASRLETLQAEIIKLQETPPFELKTEFDTMNAQGLSDLQQRLIAKEADLRALRTRITDLNRDLETLQTRRQVAPNEQSESIERIQTLTEQIAEFVEGEVDPVIRAERLSIRAQLYMRRAMVSALEQEIISFADRQRLITANRDLAQLELKRLIEEVAALQRLTGQQKLIDANRMLNEARETLNALEAPHPMVGAYAQENIALAERLGEIALEESRLPKRTAETRTKVDIVEADLRTATALIDLGNLSRQSATTLRQLRNDTPSVLTIRADIKSVNERIAAATQGRLLAQDRLRDFLPGDLDIRKVELDWAANNIDSLPLSETGREALNRLHDERRVLLSDMTDATSGVYDSLTTLKTVLNTLLERTETLNFQLDQNLLWLPSTTAIGLTWPLQVADGMFQTFNLKRIELATNTLFTSARHNLLYVLFMLIVMLSCYLLRVPLWKRIEHRASLVGRVQLDTYWHTPAVLIAGVIIALPLAIFFYLLSTLIQLSNITDNFIVSLGNTFAYLSVFTLFFLTWRAWDKDLSLFDAHFTLAKTIRHSINRQLRWFIPVAGTLSALIVLTENSKSPAVYEGFSLAAFIALCATLCLFAYNSLWRNRREKDRRLPQTSLWRKYRPYAAIAGIGLPFLSALFAAGGYYDTASELMGRVFLSIWLVVGTYVVHGVISRFILVGKRRLALRQAIERRDKAIKAREEKAAAEERGEAMPPPTVDYETIDVETLSRQTAQLIDVIIAIGFAALMWMMWSSLLPALTFFNGVELSSYMVEVIDPESGQATKVERVLTLWNIMQAMVLALVTVIAARNLPSFLEIFVLSRVGIDAGTRYAIVTILGYVIIAFGIFFTFARLGLQWSQLKFVAAGLSVGIGFGLQKIIANFVSGLIILFERPIRIGDYVTIGDQSGTVSRIQIRATTLVDLDNREILIPNEALISERVTNWTLSDSVTRLIVPVGIAYGSDTDFAKDVMLEALNTVPIVLDTPPAQVLFMGFGDSSLDFELRVFLKCFEDRIPTRHQIHMVINKALEEAGISIPFPQRDLHIIEPQITSKTNKSSSKPSGKPKKV